VLGIQKHLHVELSEIDKAGMVFGFDIDIDDFLHMEVEEKE